MSEKVTITAIVGIVVLESVALFKGIDGIFLWTSIAAISGIAGYKTKEYSK